jgi:hypothetical protein
VSGEAGENRSGDGKGGGPNRLPLRGGDAGAIFVADDLVNRRSRPVAHREPDERVVLAILPRPKDGCWEVLGAEEGTWSRPDWGRRSGGPAGAAREPLGY